MIRDNSEPKFEPGFYWMLKIKQNDKREYCYSGPYSSITKASTDLNLSRKSWENRGWEFVSENYYTEKEIEAMVAV